MSENLTGKRLFTGKTLRRPGDAVMPGLPGDLEGLAIPDVDVVLCLQGGGARAAYQVGVYEALVKRELSPDWIIGVSSGALNGAIIAGNRPEDRQPRLDRFWKKYLRSPWDLPSIGRQGKRMRRVSAQIDGLLTIFGKPHFYWPRLDSPLWDPTALSFYDQDPLRQTMRKLVNFDCLNNRKNQQGLRLSVGCADLKKGTLRFFDNYLDIHLDDDVPLTTPQLATVRFVKKASSAEPRATPRPTKFNVEHLMAASAYPPGAEAVKIEGRSYWDAGVLDNSPLDAVTADINHARARGTRRRLMIFLVDLWARNAPVPRSVLGASWRKTEMEHASRVSSDVERFQVSFAGGSLIEVFHITYRSPDADPTDPIDFSSVGIAERRALGFAQTIEALKDWGKKDALTAMEGPERIPHGALLVHRYDHGRLVDQGWNVPDREPPPISSSPSG
jgi:predicted acylesterase/phospholipase RssA